MELLQKQNWISLTSIKVGILICLPAMMFGNILVKSYGLYSTIIGLIGGGLLSLVLSLIMLKLIDKHKGKSMPEIVECYFGKIGTIFYSIGSSIALLGWFGIQLVVMADIVHTIIGGNLIIIDIILGLCIIALVAIGIKSIEVFANISMVFMIPSLLYAMYLMIHSAHGVILAEHFSFSYKPIIIICASFFVGILDLPTYYRYSKSNYDSILSFLCTYFIFLPLVFSVGIIAALYMPSVSFNEALISSFSLQIEKNCMALFMIIAGLTTNNGNLYSAVNVIKNRINSSYTALVVILGIFGILVSLSPFLNDLNRFLDCMILVVACVGGIIISQISNVKKSLLINTINDYVFIVSIGVGVYEIIANTSLTGFVFIDTFLIGLLGGSLVLIYHKGKNNE